jgi:predicted outer membrane lipoprotein
MVGAIATTMGTNLNLASTLKGLNLQKNPFRVEAFFRYFDPRVVASSNPGLKLANAFGVMCPRFKLANAFGVIVRRFKLANAFGVMCPGSN